LPDGWAGRQSSTFTEESLLSGQLPFNNNLLD
jgi:hypothetical protein